MRAAGAHEGKNPVEIPAIAGRLWTVDDVSRYLGVPVQTLYQWRHRGEGPPCARLGKHLRFDPEGVRAWVASRVA